MVTNRSLSVKVSHCAPYLVYFLVMLVSANAEIVLECVLLIPISIYSTLETFLGTSQTYGDVVQFHPHGISKLLKIISKTTF